tara:strand:+ start:308 stop:484 length:177 start_codon:yes stop_codon:yes gene_type:complete
MNWQEFKDKVDAELARQYGKGFRHSQFNIDWIDVHMPDDADVEIANEGGTVSIRVRNK